MGGTRGAREYWGESLDEDMAWAGYVDEYANKTLPNIPINAEVRDSGIWTTYSGFTLRDQIREEEANSSEAIPLQFRYEAADCRLYYTLKNLYNMTQQWRDAAAATWDNSSLCVEGSTGYSNNGNGTAINEPPVANSSTLFTPFYDMNDPATLGVNDTAGEDSDPGNDQSDGSGKTKTGLAACGTNDSCPGKFKCYPVSISCSSSSSSKKQVTTKVNACLPPCSDDQSCKAFDTKGTEGLTCWTSAEKVNTKTNSYIKLSGVSAGNATIPQADTVDGNIKRCKPRSGTYQKGKTAGTCVL